MNENEKEYLLSGDGHCCSVRDLFKKKLKDLGYILNDFGLYSLKADGATATTNNGVPFSL